MTQKDKRQNQKLTGASIAGSEHPQSISFPNGAVYNKAYLDMIVAEAEQAIKDEILKARPALRPVDWNDISTPELIAKQSEAYGRNEGIKDWSKALGIGE